MEAQEMLSHDYHAYLRIAAELPTQMRACGVFETQTRVGEHFLIFSHEGTIQVDEVRGLALTSIDRILYACFGKDGRGGVGYPLKPQNLEQVVPEHMRILKEAISAVQMSLDGFAFYKK